MAGAHTLMFDDSNFETDVIGSDVPVLVDFWAQWCGPCVSLAPTIDELANDYHGRIKIGKLDVDASPALAARFGVLNIPTVLLFERGQVTQRLVGAKPKKDYKAILDAKAGAAR
ncbi:MAG: Thioredoxin C-1 [Phycisphaerae bacterium]|nr:Thioredoxin C-1 [Phycisphaerae bacterium]